MSLTLYYHPLSSFCHKALLALYELQVQFDGRIIDLANPAERAELQALWPLVKFPVIRDADHDVSFPETSIIIEYIDHRANRNHRLIPLDFQQAIEVRLWDRFFDQYVHLPMQRIVADKLRKPGTQDATAVAEARSMLVASYAMLNERMASRNWAVVDRFSMADCAAAPALFYAGILQPFADEFAHLATYFNRLAERASFKRVIDEARPYFSMFPFAADIPARFR